MSDISIESQFLKFPTSMISDALDEIGINGAVSGISAQRYDQGRVVGRALPVKFEKKDKDPKAWRFGGGVGKPLEQVLKTMTKGQVVVMDLQGAINATAWGGLASKLAQKKGVVGTIMNGTCRDLEEIRECGYPVWAIGVCPRRSRNDFTFGSINETISVADVEISKNDIIVADQSGVVCVPESKVNKILELLKKISKQEDILEDQVLRNVVQNWDEL
ncbi:MAG: RraA family protein [Candidatus Puniceispirillales bacterium]|tara:strand:- start:774 stop:1427 length:654 start_codon:yes stop_codon:yes gene_type:complete